MVKPAEKLAAINTWFSGANVVYGGLIWSAVTILFFLMFSITPPDADSPFWYLLGTYILETVPYGIGAWLCYRNWQSPQIASGREVWLYIGIGLACYFVANFIFGIWELYFGLDPEISPADILYLAFTFLVGWGMILAVLPRRLNLEMKQWLIVAGIAIAGLIFALWLVIAPPVEAEVEPVPEPMPTAQPSPNATAPAIPAPAAPIEPIETVEEVANLPGWVVATDDFLNNFADPVNYFYIFGDLALLIISATLLLAFWGGRFSQSWRMIAAAALAKYIADMSFEYTTKALPEYESGGLLEMFYVFSGVLFAVGAALEYQVSASRPSRTRRRRGTG
ncbi:MAG: hypothetical protein HC838_13065 [Spirulinaceae cyanobacterium RM2_2_10]|nr:hypothetical protein [Spirulinaceae cyanobacterium SM2_1_0]NJO20775.1 hypothetical protein [Spirulinaceae cyanobacterium RM2_2_10]